MATPPGAILRNRHVQIAVALFALTELAYLAYWLAFYPGAWSPDSFNQWRQLEKRMLDDWHPYVHTLWLGLLTLGSGLPGAVTLAQLTINALLVAAISAWLIAQQVSARIVLLSHALLALMPSVAYYSITPWKDVTAAQFVLAMTFGWVLLARHTFPVGRKGFAAVAAFAGLNFMAAMTRHNHVLLLLLGPALVWLGTRQPLRLKAVFTVVLALLYALESLPLLLGIIPSSAYLPGFELWLLTYSSHNNSATLTAADNAYLSTLVPNISRASQCLYWDDMVAYGALDALARDPAAADRIGTMFARQLATNPGLLMAQRVCTFVPTLGLQTYRWVFWKDPIPEAGARFATQPKIQWLHDLLAAMLDWTDNYPQRYLFWNHAFSLLALCWIALLAFKRSSALLAGVFLIYASLVATVFFTSISVDWRYDYFVYLFAFYAPALVLLDAKSAVKAEP